MEGVVWSAASHGNLFENINTCAAPSCVALSCGRKRPKVTQVSHLNNAQAGLLSLQSTD